MPDSCSIPRATVTGARLHYYSTLQICKSADDQQIKKAYRKLALKWHPDKNAEDKDEAEKQFKLISEAYQVLSDKEKRTVYDRHGPSGLDGSVPAPSSPHPPPFSFPSSYNFRSPFDVFQEFFGTGDPFHDFFRHDPFSEFNGFARPFFATPFHGPGESLASKYQTGLAFCDPFSFVDQLDQENNQPKSGGFSSTISFMSGKPGEAAGVRKTSTSTKLVHGKTIVTKKIEENGKEIVVEVMEDGKLKCSTGKPSAVQPTRPKHKKSVEVTV